MLSGVRPYVVYLYLGAEQVYSQGKKDSILISYLDAVIEYVKYIVFFIGLSR